MDVPERRAYLQCDWREVVMNASTATATRAEPAASIDLGHALGTDYFLLRGDLSSQELDYLTRTRAFVEAEVLPVINDYWERAEFPRELCRRLGELGLVGDGLDGYGCPEMSPLAAGLINMELSRGDGSLGTFLGVQAGLAMRSIHMPGPRTRRRRGSRRWLVSRSSVRSRSPSPTTAPTRWRWRRGRAGKATTT